ncbi:hypothetical protein K432DRAFT_269914, partial [Lepidopterella palustris CBS 459.81]
RRKRREALLTLPPNLNNAYGITIERIEKQEKGSVQLATTILMWIHLAERPLSIDELLDACATVEMDEDLDEENFPSRGTFLDCCLGLATVEKETSTVRLVHYSLQEYLRKIGRILSLPIQEAQNTNARVCLTYLMFRSVTTSISPTNDPKNSELEASTPSHALLDYAASQWGHHI